MARTCAEPPRGAIAVSHPGRRPSIGATPTRPRVQRDNADTLRAVDLWGDLAQIGNALVGPGTLAAAWFGRRLWASTAELARQTHRANELVQAAAESELQQRYRPLLRVSVARISPSEATLLVAHRAESPCEVIESLEAQFTVYNNGTSQPLGAVAWFTGGRDRRISALTSNLRRGESAEWPIGHDSEAMRIRSREGRIRVILNATSGIGEIPSSALRRQLSEPVSFTWRYVALVAPGYVGIDLS